MKKKSFVGTTIVMLIAIAIVIVVPFSVVPTHLSAYDIGGDGVSVEEMILSEKNAILQKYSIEDIKATESFFLNRPYDGIGQVIDVNEDGIVDISDFCRLKHDYKIEGNYYELLSEFNQSCEPQYSISAENGEDISNIVIVQAKEKYDFSKFNPISILGDTEYFYLLNFDSIADASECVEILNKSESIVYAQMDGLVEVIPEDMEVSPNELQIESSFLSWGVSEIEADKYASYLSQNYNGRITVAVIDSGVANHNFLNSRVLSSGYDMVNNDSDPSDDQGHGTHVAGTIVDCTPGLNINILPIKVLDSKGSGSDSKVIAGIKYAIDHNVDVINLSLGPNSRVSPGGAFEQWVNRAVAEGIVVVKAAGNETDDTKYRSPANSKDCIVVSAIDSSYATVFPYLKNPFGSNYGESVDVCAPGVFIKSTTYDGKYGEKSGTSMATPHIAAAAAMIKYQYPTYSPAQVESSLISTCKDLGTPGKDVYYGYGVPKLSSLIKSSIKPCISLSSSTATLYTGQKYTLSASVTPGDVLINWTTSDSTVASVYNGSITANGEGSAIITAFFTYNGINYSAQCKVTVKKPGISLSESTKSVYQTNTFTLKAETLPASQTVFWSSSNSNIATVSNGVVTALSPGTVTISASMTYSGKTYSATCSVTVKEVSVKLDQTSKTVYQTDEFTLTASSTPSGQTINWASSDSNIAKVIDGKVVAVNPGTAKITASISYGGKTFSATCSVIVKKVSVELNVHEKTVLIGESAALSASTSPEGMSVSWSSENNMVASVEGGKITAKAPGKIMIAASITYNKKTYTDKCTLTVVMPSVKMTYTQAKISKNETLKLIADTLPANQSISWYSEDTSICTVNSSGVITGKDIGNTIVYASITYEGTTYTDKCNVIVGKPQVTLDKSSLTFYVGDTYSLVASVIAVDGTNISSETKSDISWTSSNSNVATVDSNGAVKAIAMGSATITAKYEFCGVTYSATCSVTVQGKPEISLNKSSLSMYIGDTSTLTAKVTPSDSSVSWSSSNSGVAMVSNGKVTAVSNGTATITASFRFNGVNYSTTCAVTVIKPSISVGVCNTTNGSAWLGDQYIYMGKSGNIPSGVTVNWKSSDTNIAKVDSQGKITTVNGGTVTITGSFTYGGNTYSSSDSFKVMTQNSVRTFFVYPSTDEDKHIKARGDSSTEFSFKANVGFVADRVTIQVCTNYYELQNNGTIYDYVPLSKEVEMSRVDASHWEYSTRFTGFDPGTYIVRCTAYSGTSHPKQVYVQLIMS